MTIHDKHMHRIELVNRSTTKEEHDIRERELNAWRCGIEDAGIRLDYMAGDRYYLEQGIDRPICCGVWIDWHEANIRSQR